MVDDGERSGPPKRYGLILPGKKNSGFMPAVSRIKPKLFDEDEALEKGDDSDDETNEKPIDWVEETLKSQTIKKKQLRMTYQKALEEDPTIYQFDEVYDEIKAQRDKQDPSSGENVSKEKPKSRYIETLQRAAEKRKKELERRQERKIQKEREEEAGKFSDKDTFVTSSYRKKMEEMMADDAEERRKQLEEEATDVTKQSDLSGFYRHLYRETLDEGSKEDKPKNQVSDTQMSTSSSSVEKPAPSTSSSSKPRQYRARRESESPEPVEKEVKIDQPVSGSANLDADSDLDISESSEEEGEIVLEKSGLKESSKTANSSRGKPHEFKRPANVEETKPKDKGRDSEKRRDKERGKGKGKENYVLEAQEPEKKKKKVDIRELFKKRTVGIVFDEALERYYRRKAFGISGLKRGLG